MVLESRADAEVEPDALVASMLHYGSYTVGEIKAYLAQRGVKVRLA